MEVLFSHHLLGGCSQWRAVSGGAVAEARPQCAVLARALRNGSAESAVKPGGRR